MPLPLPQFAAPLRAALLTYAAGGAPYESFREVVDLYDEIAPGLDWDERHRLFRETVRVFEHRPARVTALLPFLLADDDWLLVRYAVGTIWELWPRDARRVDDDVVHMQLRTLGHLVDDPDHTVRAGAMLAGMVRVAALGPQIVRLHGMWHLLEGEGRRECLRQMVGTNSLAALAWLDAWRFATRDAEEAEHLRMIVEGAFWRNDWFWSEDARGERRGHTTAEARAFLARRWRRLARCREFEPELREIVERESRRWDGTVRESSAGMTWCDEQQETNA